ncbi:hypothetical protein LTR35_011625 [Friedmanniomyces endolithicus]|nr:hypothetical protein LTR35_011625 [Friedmanniomyces endolithicus]KAK0287760.1 hypothetical protein LTS00_009872 [Friedmanniomyces endolithicus]KAK0994634.1 hypothetical protein LTR54_010731 [Friedmanniomyces endolithicus]
MIPSGSHQTRLAVAPSPRSPTTTTPDPTAANREVRPIRRSFLLDITPELRNLIYEAVLASTGGAQLSANFHRKDLCFASTLPRTNKQVRWEFSTAALSIADIHTIAPHFSFRHIVAFLNRLQDVDLRALPTLKLPAQRRVVIELIPIGPLVPLFLDRWVRRAAHPTKKGTEVNFEYRLPEGEGEGGIREDFGSVAEGKHGELREKYGRQGLAEAVWTFVGVAPGKCSR